MKKILAIVMTVAMLLSLSAISASALTAEDVAWTPGCFTGGSADAFSPVGQIEITWDADASSKLDLSDGDMADWAAAGYNVVTIEPENMVSWVGGGADNPAAGMPAGWNISTYFVMDSDWLYIGFYVTDSDFTYGTSANGYNGDAFQVCIDFGGAMGKAVEADDGALTNPKNIFYSFTCVEDGAPIEIQLQESDQDGMLTEANGDGVKGAARKTDTGWSAEFALSLQMMYDHYVWKAWAEDPTIYVGGDDEIPFEIGCALYYLNRTEPAGGITWAASTTNGYMIDDTTPGVSWTCFDNGVELYLPITDEVSFTSDKIHILEVGETTALETEAPTDEETTVEETEAPTQAEEATTAEQATDAATGDNAAATTAAAGGDDEGCGSVIGMSAVAILAAAAAAVVLKKKD